MTSSDQEKVYIGDVSSLVNGGKGLLFKVTEDYLQKDADGCLQADGFLQKDADGSSQADGFLQKDADGSSQAEGSSKKDAQSFSKKTIDEVNLIPAFAIRYNDAIYAFKNRCGHIAVTLDFQPGHFFDESGEMLICSTHGASYSPDSGKCLGGPCYGVGLEPLKIIVENEKLYLNDDSVSLVSEEGLTE